MGSTDSAGEATRLDRRRRRRRVRLLVALAILVLLAPAAYSYTTTMMQPSSLPLWPRSVEWLRRTTATGWSTRSSTTTTAGRRRRRVALSSTSLPTVGLGAVAGGDGESPTPAGRVLAAADRARLRPPAARRRSVEGYRPARGRTPAGARDDVPDRGRLSADRRVRRVVRPHAYLRAPAIRAGTSRRTRPYGGRCRCPTASAGACSRRSTAASSTATAATDRRSTGASYEPLKAGLATLIAYRDGRVDVKTWTRRAGCGPAVAFARQSLPLIIDHGRLNPALNDSLAMGLHARERGPRVAHRASASTGTAT